MRDVDSPDSDPKHDACKAPNLEIAKLSVEHSVSDY